MNIARQYAEEIRDETNYSVTWLPNVKIAVGAVCRLHRFQYDQVSDLASKGIPFEIDGGSAAEITYASSGVQLVNAGVSGGTSGAAASVGNVSGSAKISFKSAGGIVFEATGCHSARIRDLDGIGKKVLALHSVGEWEPDLVIVTEVLSSESTTILISSEDNASVDLAATGNAVPALGNLAKLAGNLQITGDRSIGVKVVGTSLTPLFRAAGVKRRFFGSDRFRAVRNGAASVETLFGRVDYNDFADGD